MAKIMPHIATYMCDFTMYMCDIRHYKLAYDHVKLASQLATRYKVNAQLHKNY